MLYKKKKWMAIIFVLPFVLFAGVFIAYPLVQNILNMFLRYENFVDYNPVNVGWDNFVSLASETYFGKSIGNTFILIACVIIFQMGIALILALLVNAIKHGQQVFRALYFVPIVISGAAIGLMFTIFSNEYTGLFNTILRDWFGIDHGSWLPNNKWFPTLMFVMVPIIWQYIGFYFVILLTGLANISDDVMEAAALDGASGLKRVFYITLPMLQNVFRTCMVLAITGALKVYDIPQVLARGNGDAYFMGTFSQMLYDKQVDGYQHIGESAVYSMLLIIIGIAVSQISNLVLKENKDI